jgi:hypothetical protein|tara:strand:+ start:168 stop:350 length:183 start_codon:yes stop_codon:yes gene_type:complete
MAEIFIFISYVLGTAMGIYIGKTKVKNVIENTIDNLIAQGFLKYKKDKNGEIEIMKWNER